MESCGGCGSGNLTISYIGSSRPDALAKDDNIKQVRFELDRPKARTQEKAERLLAEREKKRAIEREDSRQRGERERESEPVKTHKDFHAAYRQEQQGKPTIYETEYAAPTDSLQQHVDDDDDTISVVSYANSIASIFSNSAASSTTEFSTIGGYSPGDVITASKELASIFHENEIMLPLYKSALGSPAIGPERLEETCGVFSKPTQRT
jgi:hypothetical protein